MSFTDTFKINDQIFNALSKIRNNKKSITEEEPLVSKKKFKLMVNEFTEEAFKKKIKVDNSIYEVLLKNFTKSEKEQIASVINEVTDLVHEIYQFINIEPKYVGFKKVEIDELSENQLISEAKNILNDYLKINYYDLSKKELEKKYKNQTLALSKTLLEEEGLNEKEAVEYSIKVAILENLLYDIHFPFVVRHYLEETTTNSLYNEFFDINNFNDLKERYEIKKHQLARLLAIKI